MRRMFSKNQLEELALKTIENADSLQVFESIDDKDGHARFIEGSITSEAEGLTITYGKWSLSGSHLMFVLAGTYAENTTLTDGDVLGVANNIPDWIKDKIYPIKDPVVESSLFEGMNSDWTTYNLTVLLNKMANMVIVKNGTITLSKAGAFRFAFDLLIDNE